MTPLIVLSLVAIFTSACALSAWKAHARLRIRHDELCALHEREAQVLAATREFVEASRVSSDAVIERLAYSLRRQDPSIDAFLFFAPEGEELACVFADGPRANHYRSVRLRRDPRGTLPARAAGAGHRVSGRDGALIPNDRHAMAVPMQDREGLRAVVYVSSSRSCEISDVETVVRTIEHATPPFALALERENDRSDATYDGLTGLLTPRAFRDRLRSEIARLGTATSAMLSLWFVDTDRFKSVNDAYGHAAGDRVLQAMAMLLREHAVGGLDVVARNGGDEFCALVFDSQKTAAIERAQAFCRAVRAFDFGLPVRITASVGVASYPCDARDASELLEVADAAMYFSKRGGRDRVSFAVERESYSTYR